jgi:hypothetical protein
MVAKQTKRATKETPIAVKAKGASALTPLDGNETALVPMPKNSALSLDVGISALREYAAAEVEDGQVKQLAEGVKLRRGRAQVALAIAFYKAAMADKSIHLADSLLPAKGNKATKDKLSAQLRLVVGLSEIKNGKTVWTPEAREIMMTEKTDSAETAKQKESLRVNFSALMTKSAQVALDAVENGVKFELDPTTGFARITDGKGGTSVKKHFGVSSVVLNEDQNATVTDKKGNETKFKLKALPSFTEIQRKVAAAHGKVAKERGDKRVSLADPIKDRKMWPYGYGNRQASCGKVERIDRSTRKSTQCN